MNILVTGAGALLGQGIIRSLQASALEPRIVAVDPSPLAAGLYWADARYVVPMASDDDYLPQMQRILERERPDAVLVGTDVELELFARHRQELEAAYGTKIVVSSSRVIDIADDKYLTYQFLKAQGFDYPVSCLPGQREALIEHVGFPLIVKPRVGARSKGVFRVNNREELERALAKSVGEVIIQECVATEDDEYTAGVLVFEGRCEASIVMRRDLRDGNTYRAYVDTFPELNTVVCELGRRLNPHGPANFQFRLSHSGRVKVFEINARFSGTTPLRALAGFNEVEMTLRKLLLGQALAAPRIEPMTIVRHWSDTVLRHGDLSSVIQP